MEKSFLTEEQIDNGDYTQSFSIGQFEQINIVSKQGEIVGGFLIPLEFKKDLENT